MGQAEPTTVRSPPRICFLVHDLGDAAVKRRVGMLAAGGARVLLAGFRRGESPPGEVASVVPVDLGRTYDRAFVRRIASVLGGLARMRALAKQIGNVDAIAARNLEMLALAVRLNALLPRRVPVTYECLDIHPLMLGDGPGARALRALEGWLARRCSLLVTSSPQYLQKYFAELSQVRLPSVLVPNKVLDVEGRLLQALASETPGQRSGPPWRIGWFGILRCRRSLDALRELAAEGGGAIEVVIRGRPAYTELADFDEVVAHTPHLRFEGPYENPQDLARIYADVHFSWAIDYLYAGKNSEWALANRIYEGGLYGALPLAVEGTATAAWLQSRGVGIVLDDALVASFRRAIAGLDRERYERMQQALAALPRTEFVADRAECVHLVQLIAAATTQDERAARP